MNFKAIGIVTVLMIILSFIIALFLNNVWTFFIGGLIGAILLGLFGSFDRIESIKHGAVSGVIAGLIYIILFLFISKESSLQVFSIVLGGLIASGIIGGFISSLIWKKNVS
ncbi:hypothetical protein [Methanobacterium sp.]|uniref:hypothetical protein n=1 Tax=Methanobacterium sp. TaxID=2164 RepID=UPI002AB8053E|nr:hypothetical protein [Methanobacterium sp.]MDY9922797.1 hypothetical protein [Methanobacterium sp.]